MITPVCGTTSTQLVPSVVPTTRKVTEPLWPSCTPTVALKALHLPLSSKPTSAGEWVPRPLVYCLPPITIGPPSPFWFSPTSLSRSTGPQPLELYLGLKGRSER